MIVAQPADDMLTSAEALIKNEDLRAAEETLQQAKKLEPEHVGVLYQLGYVQYRQRELAAARGNFETVVRLAPPAYYSRYFLGRICLLENNPLEAITWLEPIQKAGQAVFDTSAQLAAAYGAAGRDAEALESLKIATLESPWDAALHYRLGRLYGKLGKRELADEALKQSARLRNTSREDVETLMEVARLIGERKRSEALQSGAKIRDRRSSDPNALIALGVLYGNGGFQAEALDIFERASTIDPGSFQAHYNHGLALLKINRTADSLEMLASAVKLLPESPEANKAYGLSAVLNRRYAEAIVPLERAWQAFPADFRLGALLATACLRAGKATRAVEILSAPVLATANEPAPHLLRIEALNAAEKPEEALTAAKNLQRLFPTLSQAHLALAQQLARVGRYSEAKPVFAEAVRQMPANPEAALGLADTLARSGAHSDALMHYRDAVENPRTSAAARAGLARSLISLRQLEEAIEVLEESIRLYPSDAALHVELSRAYARSGKAGRAAEQARIAEGLGQAAGQR